MKIKIVLYLFLYRLKNNFYALTHKFDKHINILSNKEHKYKSKEDLMLQEALLKNGVKTKIIAYEDNIDDNIVIRTIWGFNNNVDLFINYLNSNTHIVLNNKDIILNNMNKKNQYDLLVKYDIPHIDTVFINNIDEINNYDISNKIIKPNISESGNNTFLTQNSDKENIIYHYKNNNINNVMIQPFIDSVKEGEISLILINNNLEYAIRRYAGVIYDYTKVLYLPFSDLDNSILSIVDKIKSIKEYEDNVFMRVDLVKDHDTYKVMELELVDPQLFFDTVPDENKRKEVVDKLAKAIKERL